MGQSSFVPAMDASIPVFEKPHPHLSVQDWTRNIQKLQTEARYRRFESYELRQRANQLRNESDVTTRWDTYVNTELLRDRIFEVHTWREKQRFTRECVRDEIRALKEEKNATELHLESLQVPLMVISSCLSNRDQRLPPELTRDQLGEELNKALMNSRVTLPAVRKAVFQRRRTAKKLLGCSFCYGIVKLTLALINYLCEYHELHITENSKRVLTDVCHMGWEKIKELNNVLCRLEREIKNKDETLELEYHVKDLTRNSTNISYKLDPTRVPPESMSEESYVHCIENTIKIAEQLMAESKTLRETMFRSRETARNQMYAQCQQVELVMRRRVFDIQRARNEMEWQKYKLEQNLAKVDKEIENLRAAVADKINPTKCVETRLEMRTRRPVLERVTDKPMRGLIEEFERVHTSHSMLEKKLEEALTTYHGMFNHHQRVTKDLQYKNQALETDRRLVEIRKPLHSPDETEFKRNVGYCHLSEELVPT